jgi:predicted O-methyltransferase YrrM
VSISGDIRPMIKVSSYLDVPNRFTFGRDRTGLIALFKNATRIVEFGINEGYTAKLLLDNIPSIESYVGIDVPAYHKTRLETQASEVPQDAGHVVRDDPRVRIIVRAGGSEAVTAREIGPCDAAFIDGDHSPIAVAHDTKLALACIRRGIIVWHDYCDGSPVKPMLDIMAAGGAEISHLHGTWLAYERINAKP